MSVRVLDPFTSGGLDMSKWRVQQFPTNDGNIWKYEDPDACVRTEDGVLEIAVQRFQLQHDLVPMFDNPKHLFMMQHAVPMSDRGVTTISCDMACENHNGNPDDLLDGFIGLIIGDLATGMIFDFIISSTRIGAVYERLPLPGITPPGGEWVHVIQSPLVVQNAPGEFHRYEIRINRTARTCEWLADGKRIYHTNNIPVDVQSVVPGVGLFTLKPSVPGKGSISNHGQGATGRWKNLSVKTE